MYLFTLLLSFQKTEDARQKQQHVLSPCKTGHQFPPCRGTKLLPGEVSPGGRREGVLPTRRGKPGGGVQPGDIFHTMLEKLELWEPLDAAHG